MIRATHTYAVLPLSLAAFSEIEKALREAGYDHAFDKDEGGLVIDMHGIAVQAKAEPTRAATPPEGEDSSVAP